MTDYRRRYPRLIRAMMWVAILSEGEAVACIRDYKEGSDFSGEAVNHYGGTKKVLRRSASAHVRHVLPDLLRLAKGD